MKFGIFYEHQIGRPWDDGTEHRDDAEHEHDGAGPDHGVPVQLAAREDGRVGLEHDVGVEAGRLHRGVLAQSGVRR